MLTSVVRTPSGTHLCIDTRRESYMSHVEYAYMSLQQVMAASKNQNIQTMKLALLY